MTTTQKIKREIRRILGQMGIVEPLRKAMSKAEIAHDIAEFKRLNKDTRFVMKKENEWICRYDKYAENGTITDSSYFIQDIWGARKVMENRPAVHYDVGSSVAGFIAHLLAQKQKIMLIDIRKMSNDFDTPFLNGGGESPSNKQNCGIEYIQADATNLENIADESIESISALCSVEHFGLGRYGDKIQPDAWECALKAFQRVLKKGGRLYFSVPVGQISKVCFNAHRVFRPELIIDTLESMDIVEFSYIDGFGTTICMERKNGALQVYKDKLASIPEFKNWGNTGLFEFVKK